MIESVDDDIGFEISDDPNCVFDDSLLAPYGKGYFVYTGISFFRQLPAGVPGAYRLLANLMNLSHQAESGNE